MAIHSHDFVETYKGLVGFGADRKTDENTVVYYLQKFSDDQLMKTIIERLSDEDLAEIFSFITRLLYFTASANMAKMFQALNAVLTGMVVSLLTDSTRS